MVLYNGKLFFINGTRSSLTNPPESIILDICIFDNFTLAEELFSKDFQIFAICRLSSIT